MTDPSPSLGPAEALALARIEVKLDNALDAQKEHKSLLDRYGTDLTALATRLTRLETRDEAEVATSQRTYSGKQLVATGTGAAAAVGGLLAAFLQSTGRG